MNADSAPSGRQPSDQANRLGHFQTEMAAIVNIHHRHFIITQPESWYSFYRPTKGGRLSRPWHCSKGVQPVPKAVYCSGCRDRHNCPRWDSNLGSLTLQSGMLPLGHCDTADNWPRLLTQLTGHWLNGCFVVVVVAASVVALVRWKIWCLLAISVNELCGGLFSDSQPSVWSCRHHVWPLPRSIWYILRCNANRQGHHQNAHPGQ